MFHARLRPHLPANRHLRTQTLEILQRPGSYDKLEALSKRMVEGILAAAKEHGHEATGGYIRGMFGFFFNKGPVNNFVDASKSDSGPCVFEREFYVCSWTAVAGCSMNRCLSAGTNGKRFERPFVVWDIIREGHQGG